MSVVVLKYETRQARKTYKCDAYDWFVRCGCDARDLTEDQLLILQSAEAEKGRILRGQWYIYTRGVEDGSMFTWRARPGMDSICSDLGLYEEW